MVAKKIIYTYSFEKSAEWYYFGDLKIRGPIFF